MYRDVVLTSRYAKLLHMEQKNNKNKKNFDKIIFKPACQCKEIAVPFLQTCVSAGFPSPADDYVEQKLDLNDYLIKHPAATFFVRVEGNSMVDDNIYSGDILIVDRALPVNNDSVVVVYIDGEFTVKRIAKKDNALYLVPASKQYKPLLITSEMNIEIWGVVAYVIHKVT